MRAEVVCNCAVCGRKDTRTPRCGGPSQPDPDGAAQADAHAHARRLGPRPPADVLLHGRGPGDPGPGRGRDDYGPGARGGANDVLDGNGTKEMSVQHAVKLAEAAGQAMWGSAYECVQPASVSNTLNDDLCEKQVDHRMANCSDGYVLEKVVLIHNVCRIS
eukprot:scaffold31376_cov27-Prasinocladus_malaysianus.AAC.1